MTPDKKDTKQPEPAEQELNEQELDQVAGGAVQPKGTSWTDPNPRPKKPGYVEQDN